MVNPVIFSIPVSGTLRVLVVGVSGAVTFESEAVFMRTDDCQLKLVAI